MAVPAQVVEAAVSKPREFTTKASATDLVTETDRQSEEAVLGVSERPCLQWCICAQRSKANGVVRLQAQADNLMCARLGVYA